MSSFILNSNFILYHDAWTLEFWFTGPFANIPDIEITNDPYGDMFDPKPLGKL